MADKTIDVTLEYRIAELAAREFNPGEQPDIVKLMRAAYMHGYADALLAKKLNRPAPGCYCTTYCAAPRIMGKQTPCRDPEKAATFKI